MSRAIAEAISLIGRLAGRVPRGVRGELRLLTLREFCLLQMDAEKTAAACWRRLTQISQTIPAIDADTRSAFAQMWQDEESSPPSVPDSRGGAGRDGEPTGPDARAAPATR